MSLKELSNLLKSTEAFLNTPPEEILQIKLGNLSIEQLEEAGQIVRNDPELLEKYKYVHDEYCDVCINKIPCTDMLYRHCDYYDAPSPPNYTPISDEFRCLDVYCEMFIPEKIFRKVKGFENIPSKIPKDWFK